MNRSVEILPKRDKGKRSKVHIHEQEVGKGVKNDEYSIPPWLFRHQGVTYAFENINTVDQLDLINNLNYINFMDGYILVHMRHFRYKDSILVQAYPEPCLGSELLCRWSEENLSGVDLEKYEFLDLVMGDARSMTIVPAVLKDMNDEYIKVQLPDKGHVVGKRKARRFACHEVDVQLIQNGFLAEGELVDFSPNGFRIKVNPTLSCSFLWFNSDEPATIHLRNHRRVFFSGICRCIRQKGKSQEKEIVLKPKDESICRCKPNGPRNPRQHLVPSPTVVFDHPLLKKRIQLEVSDISTSGFSVYENDGEGVLMPGMIIPEMIIVFGGSLRMQCDAQVIHREKEDENRFRCGLSILDMNIRNYSHLTQILTSALDPHSYVSTEVDMEALWEFFFDSGFIYPKKYGLIQSHRDDFKETYEKLYKDGPEIARHFTYQKNGRIYGHISMVRAYVRAWLIHHHAALSMENKRAGFLVLKQIMHYLNDMHRMPSAEMDYVMSFFRPKNKFPRRVFGGFAEILDDCKGCSMDLFAYLPYTSLSLSARLPDGWCLRECSRIDLWELNRFYSHCSGGLLLDAMDLSEENLGGESLEGVYAKLGFFRKQRTYSLSEEGQLKAVLMVDQSDLGFNLSELLNGIKILVTDPEATPWHILSIAISRLTGVFKMDKVPVLFYPFDYVRIEDVPYEKTYEAWVLNVNYGDEFMEYMHRKFRLGYR
jgi:hypothetical protein